MCLNEYLTDLCYQKTVLTTNCGTEQVVVSDQYVCKRNNEIVDTALCEVALGPSSTTQTICCPATLPCPVAEIQSVAYKSDNIDWKTHGTQEQAPAFQHGEMRISARYLLVLA